MYYPISSLVDCHNAALIIKGQANYNGWMIHLHMITYSKLTHCKLYINMEAHIFVKTRNSSKPFSTKVQGPSLPQANIIQSDVYVALKIIRAFKNLSVNIVEKLNPRISISCKVLH